MNCIGCSSPYNNSKDIQLSDIDDISKFIIKYTEFVNIKNIELDIEHLGGEVLFKKEVEDFVDFDKSLSENFKIINSGIQTNLIINKNKIDKLENSFNSKYSTSYNFDNSRKLKNSSKLFKNQWKENYNYIFNKYNKKIPIVITISNDNVKKMKKIYQYCNRKKIDIIFRHFIPIGNGYKMKNLIPNNKIFSDSLIYILNDKNRQINVEPLNKMIDLCNNKNLDTCGFQSECYKNSINIDPEGKVYTCLELAQLGIDIGNWKEQTLNKKNIYKIIERSKQLPDLCKTCKVVDYCKGGCMAEGFTSKNNLYQETFMCESWKKVFNEILFIKNNIKY
jgi:radical SAM protein with 4Fe4S-binding SPASM domain